MNIIRELIAELRTWPVHGERQHPRPLDEVALLRASDALHRVRRRVASPLFAAAMRLEAAAYKLADRREREQAELAEQARQSSTGYPHGEDPVTMGHVARTPAHERIAAERAVAAEHAGLTPGVFTLDSEQGRAWLDVITRPSPLGEFMRECGEACDETYDERVGGCGGCGCHISGPCAHCLRRSEEAEQAGLLS